MASSTKAVSEARFVSFSVGEFDFVTTNHVAAISTKDGIHEDFHPIMDFMKNCSIGYAMSEATTINTKAVSQAWSSATIQKNGDINCMVGEIGVTINPETLRSALHLEFQESYATPANDEQIRGMLKEIGYTRSVENLSKITRKSLRKEWSFFFDQITKNFTGKCSAFDQINGFVCQLAHSLIYNKSINVAEMLMYVLRAKVNTESKKKIYFHRFFQMVLEYVLGKDRVAELCRDGVSKIPVVQEKRIFSDLHRVDSKKDSIPPMVYPTGMKHILNSTVFPQYISSIYFFVFKC